MTIPIDYFITKLYENIDNSKNWIWEQRGNVVCCIMCHLEKCLTRERER